MNVIDALALARKLLDEHDLTAWFVEMDDHHTRFGCCNHWRLTISLSRHLVAANDEDQVLDTILHEIAHCLAGHEAGHDERWRSLARKIGAKDAQCYTNEEVTAAEPTRGWVATCPGCGRKAHRVRILRGTRYSCSKCGGGRFDPRFEFAYRRVDQKKFADVTFTLTSGLVWLVNSNPKRVGSPSWKRFGSYFRSATVADFYLNRGTLADLKWDVAHGFVAIKP